MRGPALAVIGSDGQLERSTAAFSSLGDADALLERGSPDLERVLSGETSSAVLSGGGLTAAVEAIVDSSGARHAVLTLRTPAGEPDDSGDPLADEDLDASPAVIFLKDLDGRYRRVNAAHGRLIGGGEAQLLGHTDSELEPRLTVDGPRLAERDPSVPEPLQLEYIVPGLDQRPALSVLRFLVHDRDGEAVAVCGVASPLAQGEVARAEAERLMEVVRIAHLDPGEARTELLTQWGLLGNAPASRGLGGGAAPVGRAAGGEVVPGDELPGPIAAAEGSEALVIMLAEERRRAQELEAALSVAQARLEAGQPDSEEAVLRAEHARVEAEQARAESQHLRSQVELAQAETDQARAVARREHEEAETARAAAQAARGEASQALLRIEQLQAESAALSSRSEQAETEAREWRRQAEHAEVEAVQARARAEQAEEEARAARARVDETQAGTRQADGRADQAEVTARQATARAEQADAQARTAKAQAEQSEAEARQAKARAEQAESEARQAKARAEQAESEARQARLEATELQGATRQSAAELEELRGAERQARLQIEQLETAARQSRLHMEELEGVAARALARAEEAESEARDWRAKAERAEAEVAALRSEGGGGSGAAKQGRAAAAEERATVAEVRAELAALRSSEEARREQAVQGARIEAGATRAEAEAAQAQAEAARARSDAIQAQLAAAQAQVDAVQTRADTLRESMEAARREAESARAEAERARAETERARDELEVARSDAASARAEAEAARTQMEAARDEVQTARAEAATAQAAAATAQAAAETSHAAAETARTEAETARTEAETASAQAATGDRIKGRGAADAAAAPLDEEGGLRWSARSQRELARALGDADDLRAGFARATSIVGERGGWGLAAVWLPDARGLLRCSAVWSAGELAPMGQAALGAGLPVRASGHGTALYAREPVWLTEAPPELIAAAKARDGDGGAPEDRLLQAFSGGARTALLLPVRDGVARIGLLELMSVEAAPGSPELVCALEAVGLQLGQFLALMRARNGRH